MAGELESPGFASLKLDKLRSRIKDYVDRHQYESALFWAEKVVSLSDGDIKDKYWYAQTLFLTGQYSRSAIVIKSAELDKKSVAGKYLAAKCHYECREYAEALEVLDQNDAGILGAKSFSCSKDEIHDVIPTKNIDSAVNLLRGRVYEALENRNLAAECFREALRLDVYCYEAFEALMNHHMMTAQEERELMESLPFAKQCLPEEIELIRYLYETKLKKYNKPGDLAIPSSLDRLSENLGVLVGMAERHYYNCDFRKCYKIVTKVHSTDPYNSDSLPLYVAVLVELKKTNELFYLAHKLVDMYPSKSIAWFAVGCYYLLVSKHEPARRYLSKACVIDRVYGPAWLAYGHSFAAENEHDQAMAAYFTASQLMKGCHLPVLYIGLEYGLTNNAKLAERFFSQALSIAPEDPFVLHEMGVIAFQNQDYVQAERDFSSALQKIQAVSQDVLTDQWEPLLNNMGHVCRKLKKYEDALEYYRQSLILCPQNPSTLSSIGYVYALTGNSADAVDYFHKALGLRRDDTFSTTMLGYVIEQLMCEMSSCDGVPDVLPEFVCETKLDTSEVKITEIATDTSSNLLEADSTLGDTSVADSSCMMIDTDMEDA